MHQKLLSTILLPLVTNLAWGPVVAQTQSGRELLAQEKTKATVARLSTQSQQKVIVTLTDDTSIEGYITAVEDERFVVTDVKKGISFSILYVEVRNVRKRASKGLVITGLALGAAAGMGMAYLIGYGLSKCAICID